MKQLLIPLAFVTGTALACPGDAAKEAAAPAAMKSAAVAKAAPNAKVAAVKAETKLHAKTAPEAPKVAGL